MITKVLGGATVLMALFVWFLYGQLADANEEKGKLAAEVSEAVETNKFQTEQIDNLLEDQERILTDFRAAEARNARFTEVVSAGQIELEKQKNDHERELSRVRDSLQGEDLVCATARVPGAYFDGMCDGPGGCDTN